MNMKPYFEFAEDGKSRDNITVIQFDNGLMAAIIDRYCINPDCDCVAVGLEFREIDENGKLKESLFSCHMDTQTWEISKLKMGKAKVNYEFLIQEFSANLDQALKEKFRTRLRKAKEYGKDEIIDWLDNVDLNDNRCFSYTQVYGENVDEYKKFLFEYNDQQYFVDDQYCSKPKCQCEEAILSFVHLIPDREEQEVEFVLRVSLGTKNYEIEYSNNIEKEEIKQIFNRYLEHINDDLGLLRSRYAKMKEFGRKRIQRQKQKDTRKIEGPKVGRNAPCPCGSGKKYKKCCGIKKE